ncbi:hypothetical protein KCP78_14110 [Salmonella enterica subsp. enterica]|nr:hypothetical protein KCP78_14110 [Salmonella enterica subsp. enterica]
MASAGLSPLAREHELDNVDENTWVYPTLARGTHIDPTAAAPVAGLSPAGAGAYTAAWISRYCRFIPAGAGSTSQQWFQREDRGLASRWRGNT